jgi:ankyrin repeat protein
MEDGIKLLFEPEKPHLRIWVWIFNPETLSWFQGRKAKIPSPLRRTPLYYAATCGLESIVKFLVIERSQDINFCPPDTAWTPLHSAAFGAHVGVARFLLECGADVTTQDEFKSTPLHEASRAGNVELLRVLVECGADMTARDESGFTPLHVASTKGYVNLARFLLEAGADVTAQTDNGLTPLHMVAASGHVECVRLFIERGADVTAQDGTGATPLHHAAHYWGTAEVVRLLVECGTNPTAQDRHGRTPLERALQGNNAEVAQSLREVEAARQAKP